MNEENKTLIIAEAGDNHNGDINIAYKLIDVAVKAKADYVKFQTFKTESVVSKYAEMAQYQKDNTGKTESQLDMIKKLELPFSDFNKLKSYAESKGIGFMSSPFDIESIDYLYSIGVDIFKVPSGEITNLPYLERISSYKKPIILSTGMSTMDEIREAVMVIRNFGVEDITVLHCNTQYPTPYEDVNLHAMNTIKNELKVRVGYSDHTLGIEIPIAATALGAEVIEKHFTLDKSMDGPDHKASLEPDELEEMVKSIRIIEQSLGDGIKDPSRSEIQNIEIARKSIVASRNIIKGEVFTEENLQIKRPGNGISPMEWYKVLGKKATRDFKEDERIQI